MKNTLSKLFFLSLFFVSLPLFAQPVLKKENNICRGEDVIIKQQVKYKHPGRAGANVLWDFSKQELINEKYKLSYSKINDSDILIGGTEHRTLYYYGIKNDSILCWGYENPTTKMKNSCPEFLLCFPVKYGDRIKSFYQGKGMYCGRLRLSAMGTTETHADAYGVVILPNQDTLRHVIRLKTVKLIAESVSPLIHTFLNAKDSTENLYPEDSIQYRLDNDSTVLALETYRWYAPGYRYPIFETIRTGNYRDSLKTEYFSTAFFFPPEKHTYLDNDEENLEILKGRNDKDTDWGGGAKEDKNQNHPKNPLFELSYNIYPNPVHERLTVEYYLPEDARVSYGLYNLNGQQLYSSIEKDLLGGVYSEAIEMSNFPSGEYIWRIRVNENIVSEKILKK